MNQFNTKKMKIEFRIIITCIIIVTGILVLIANNPDEIILVSSLENLNQHALDAKESKDKDKLDSYKPIMQRQLQKITSSNLGIPIETIYLKEDWNFPFRDSSEIKPHSEKYSAIPICNILSNISLHLQNIRKTELFSMYGEKYQNYSIELDIADERYYNSTVHYGFVAQSGSNYASTHFHVNSCTGHTSDYIYLRCSDSVLDTSSNSNYPNEVLASLQNNKFCEINLEPWRQKLADYNKKNSDDAKKYLDQLSMKNRSAEEMIKINHELQRLDSLNEITRHAMMGDFENKKLRDEMKKYEKKFGDVPDDFLELIK